MDRVELQRVLGAGPAIVASLIATVLKFGDRTQLGAVHLATSLVADVQLIAGAIIWTWAASQPARSLARHGDDRLDVGQAHCWPTWSRWC
ncbi:MAG: DUF6394 family protein [Micropruina glycogenica]